MDQIEEIQIEFGTLMGRMFGTEPDSRIPTARGDDGTEHLEIIDGEYHLVVTERGLELNRRTTADKNELLYWLISDWAFAGGCGFEFENRVAGRDTRRIIFAKQIEFLEKVDLDWARRRQTAIEEILAKNPFNDR